MRPLAGGILDTSDCTQAQPARQIARLGDVCVSPYALNWNCKLADYSEQVRPQAFAHESARPGHTRVYGVSSVPSSIGPSRSRVS